MSIFELGLQNVNAIHVYAHVLKVQTSCERAHYFILGRRVRANSRSNNISEQDNDNFFILLTA